MEKLPKSPIAIETELSRDLGLVSALAIGVGTMVAAGIFTLSGLAIRNVGSAALASFLLAAIIALFTALTYCEFTSIYPYSGEGYRYARETFPRPIAYIVGWALFLGYTSSCAFYISSFSSYFIEFVYHTPFEALSGLVVLVLLTLVNIKGTKESGTFQIIITIAKVILLFWFVSGGIGEVSLSQLTERFSTDLVKIGSTATLVFITFFGFSAIAASAGEMKDPVKNIPRAIFLSMGIVTVLYSMVVLVIIAADLSEYTEAAMGTAAQRFLGPIGGLVIVAGALFSMISASNASIMAGSRVTMSMSRFGHFPKMFGFIHQRTRTPIVSLILVGGTISLFAVFFSLEDLAHFADTVLLLALIFVNAALIAHRRKFPKIERPFRVPLVPLLPILGIVANFYLLSQILNHALPVLAAAAAMIVGFVVFMSWKGLQAEEELIPGTPSRVVLERAAIQAEKRFRVLVPIANPANIEILIDLAAAIAAERGGEIVALRVAQVPDQVSPTMENKYVERDRPLLERAHASAQKRNIPTTSLIRVGHDAARAILETARQRDCSLILMGWKGYTSTARKILGEVVDNVVKNARSDIILVKLDGDPTFDKLLLPTAGGDHAKCAEDYAASLVGSGKGSLTVCNIVPLEAPQEEVDEAWKRLDDAVERITENRELKVDHLMIRHNSISVGIIQKAADFDAVVIGGTNRTYPEILFGSIPELVAKHASKPVILVKHYQPIKALISRIMS